MHDRTRVAPLPAEALYAALSPRAPAFVQAPSLAFGRASAEPNRLELLRREIVAAQQMGRAGRWN